MSGEARPGLTGSILVVDDNEVNRQMLSQHVAQLGHRVAAAEDGRRALALLQGGAFDLVLLDVLVPEVDGFAALERLVRRLRPPLLLHGHIHPYGAETPDRSARSLRLRSMPSRRARTREPTWVATSIQAYVIAYTTATAAGEEVGPTAGAATSVT